MLSLTTQLSKQLSKKLVVLFGLLLIGALLAGTMVIPASADSLDDRLSAAESKRNASDAQMEELKHTLAETDERLAAAYLQLKAAQDQLPVAEAALAVAQKNFDIAQREANILADKLQDARDQRVALETQIDDNDTAMTVARTGVVEMGRQAARGNMDMSGIGLIVGAESSDEFIERYNMNNTALRTQGSSLNKLRQTQAVSRNAQARLDGVNEAIETLKGEADEKLAESEDKRKIAESAKADVLGLIDQETQATQFIEGARAAAESEYQAEIQRNTNLSTELQDLYGLKEAERKAEAQRLESERQAEAKRLEDERKANANKKPTTPSKPGSPKPPSTGGGTSSGGSSSGGSSSGGAASSGVLRYPTAVPHITSSYGWRFHPIWHEQRLHAGTDFRAYCGTPLYATRGGTVYTANFRAGLGNSVFIDHGTVNGYSLMTSSNHLSSFAVSAGQSVKAGQLIGYSGTTGSSTACHLHFEVYRNGSTVNPMSMIG